MYKKIEKEFIEKSYYRKTEIFITIACCIFSIIYVGCSCNFIDNILIQLLLAVILFINILISFYIYVFINLNNLKIVKLNDFFKFATNVKKYSKHIHEEDLLNFAIILENNKVDNCEKLKEVLNHYRLIIPKKIKTSKDSIAFISLIVSFIALFSSENFAYDLHNIYYSLAIVIVSLLFFYSVNWIRIAMNLMLGKDELYIRIENALSEIYTLDLLDQNK